MYNLMVTARDNAWEEGAFDWPKSRILEYTSDENKEKFGALSAKELEELTAFPTLFMYESGTEGTPKVGRIKHIRPLGSEIRIIFEFDETIPSLTEEQIVKMKRDLGIQDFEFTRSHWAVKEVGLYRVLAKAGIPAIPESNPPVPAAVVSSEKIFLVHGRSNDALQSVARFLETKVGLKVCVLSEQPNRGRTIITKFQEEAIGATYAVVLMTPDDMGYLRPELSGVSMPVPTPRARQNVIFELGFFIAKFGANRVCVLLGDGVERPSDYEGVVYIPYDDHDGWKMKLVNELQAANVSVATNWWDNK